MGAEQTDPQEILKSLAERMPELRRTCHRKAPVHWHTKTHFKGQACPGYQPLPLLEAVAKLLDNHIVDTLYLLYQLGEWKARAVSHEMRVKEASDPDWRIAVLLAAEKALGERG